MGAGQTIADRGQIAEGVGSSVGDRLSSGLPLFIYTLRLADNALVLGHRLSEWVRNAPVLEEDSELHT